VTHSATPKLVRIAHAQFVADVATLGGALASGGWRPDHLVGIGRGGLVPGAYLSHLTGISLLSIDVSAGLADFADARLVRLAAETRAGVRFLIVDDINDSGGTLAGVRDAILGAGGDGSCVRLAVLIDNVRSPTRVDYRARSIDRTQDKSWFVFPWEAMAPDATLIADAQDVPERLG
jgi:hypoxanthine phosphoribosyltransferase